MTAPDPARPLLVDLSQPLGPATALWPGSVPFAAEVEAEEGGWYTRSLRMPEHAGTHLDAPAHRAPGGRRVHELAAEELVVPAVVLDVRARAALDPDAEVLAEDVESHEATHGRIPPGSAVLALTGWDHHVADPARYLGGPSVETLRFPGFGVEAARLLVDRDVAGIGIDTVSVDAGRATACPVHALTLPAGLWHLEGLVGLDWLPPRGALLVVGVVRLVDGSGAPARVLALLPPTFDPRRRAQTSVMPDDERSPRPQDGPGEQYPGPSSRPGASEGEEQLDSEAAQAQQEAAGDRPPGTTGA